MDEQSETHIEPTEDASSDEAVSKVAKLQAEIAKLRQEKQEYLDGWHRAKADYVNILKRFDEDRKIEHERGIIKALEALLPALDSLSRAKEHGEIPTGFQAILKQLDSAFASLGVESIGVVGEKFNPLFHEALGQDVTESKTLDDSISSVLEKGWKLEDKVIRPAKVRVAHFVSQS